MRWLAKLIGGLFIVILAGAGGGVGLMALTGFTSCEGDVKCISNRFAIFFTGTLGVVSTTSECIESDEAEKIRKRVVRLTGEDSNYGKEKFDTLWEEGASECRSTDETLIAVCLSLENLLAGPEACS